MVTALSIYYGASGRNRTGTGLTPRDFKSRASTNFATEALSDELVDPCIICILHKKIQPYLLFLPHQIKIQHKTVA